MSTTAIARGRTTQLAFGIQSAFATPATSGDYQNLAFYKETLREKEELQADPLLGQNPNNTVDQVAPAPGLPDHGGSIDLPMCWNQTGHWLRLLFGAPATTGTTDKTHVFASGTEVLPTATLEVRKLANDFRQHVGCAAQGVSFDFEDKSGFQMMKIDLAGWGENLLTSSAAGVLAAVALDQVPATKGIVRVNGVVVGSVRQGKLEYRTGIETERYVDGLGRASAAVRNRDAEAMGELRLRHTSTAFDVLAAAGTEQPVEIEFQKSVTRSIIFAMPA
jgi:hypothetical protein